MPKKKRGDEKGVNKRGKQRLFFFFLDVNSPPEEEVI